MALFRVLPIIKLYFDFRLYGCSPLPILSFCRFWLSGHWHWPEAPANPRNSEGSKASTQPQDSSAGDSGGGWGQRRAVKPIEENVNVGTIDGIEISWSFASEDFKKNPSTFRCSRRRWWFQGTCKEIENVTQAQPPCTIKRHFETRWNEHQQNYPPSAACWESNWISNQRVDSFVLTL